MNKTKELQVNADTLEVEKGAFKGLNLKEMYKNASDAGLTVSALLEKSYKSNPERFEKGEDAFERLLKAYGIRTKDNPKYGIYADTVGAFWNHKGAKTRFYKSNQPASQFLFPEFLNRTMREVLVASAILDALVTITTPIDSNSYKTIYLEDITDSERVKSVQMYRVAEGAEVPEVLITTSEHEVKLHKYGVALKATYESIRRIKIDLLQIHIKKIMEQVALDQAYDAIDILMNGDGNGNVAPIDLTSVLDTSGTGLTYTAFVNWVMSFYPYKLNTIVGNRATLLKLLTLSMSTANPLTLLGMINVSGSLQIPTLSTPQGFFNNINVLMHDAIADDKLLGFDESYACEKVIETGSQITETDKIIRSQFEEIVMTEVTGFAKLDKNSARVLQIDDEA